MEIFLPVWEGTHAELPPVATGSHTDAIPNAGDMTASSACSAHSKPCGRCARRDSSGALDRDHHVHGGRADAIRARLSREPLAFRRVATRPEQALALRSRESESLADLKLQAGYAEDPSLTSVRLQPDIYRAFVELHIEQGPLLENEGFDIGAVEKIAAPSAFRFRLEGSGGHAGGVLMPGRRDALLAASEIALAVEKAALESGSPDTVGTTGVLTIEPGAINSIPCRALMEIDLRDTNVKTRQKAFDEIQQAAAEICARRRIDCQFESINSDPPAICDPGLVDLILRETTANRLQARRQISRAYHDSLFMALLCPTAMIFVPCRNGYSHRPDEYSSPEQIAAGVQVLGGVLRELAGA